MRVLIFFLSIMTITSALGAQNRGTAPSAGTAAGDAQAAPTGDAQNGKKIFASHGCYPVPWLRRSGRGRTSTRAASVSICGTLPLCPPAHRGDASLYG